MIKVENLTRHFGDIKAVEGINFTVQPGEVLGFLGPNGAGKSTTMKMLAGFLTPTSGKASIFGHDIVTQSLEARRMLGYLPEGAPSYGEMSVTRFLDFIAQARGLKGSAGEKAKQKVIDELHLEKVLNQPIDTLSKGFKRRVGLAQAIIHNPRVLLLDEPTDGLDPNQKAEVRALIRSMAEDRIIMISTHILEEVDALCQRAIIIARGKILADETPQQLESRSRYHQAVTLHCNDLESVANKIQNLAKVSSIEYQEDQRSITAFPEKGQSIFKEINALVDENEWQVSAIQMESGRLDEVFRTITTGVTGQ